MTLLTREKRNIQYQTIIEYNIRENTVLRCKSLRHFSLCYFRYCCCYQTLKKTRSYRKMPFAFCFIRLIKKETKPKKNQKALRASIMIKSPSHFLSKSPVILPLFEVRAGGDYMFLQKNQNRKADKKGYGWALYPESFTECKIKKHCWLLYFFFPVPFIFLFSIIFPSQRGCSADGKLQKVLKFVSCGLTSHSPSHRKNL